MLIAVVRTYSTRTASINTKTGTTHKHTQAVSSASTPFNSLVSLLLLPEHPPPPPSLLCLSLSPDNPLFLPLSFPVASTLKGDSLGCETDGNVVLKTDEGATMRG